jgi:hypothetical protein
MFKSDDLYQEMRSKMSEAKMQIAVEALDDIEGSIKEISENNEINVSDITDEIMDLKIFLTTK